MSDGQQFAAERARADRADATLRILLEEIEDGGVCPFCHGYSPDFETPIAHRGECPVPRALEGAG